MSVVILNINVLKCQLIFDNYFRSMSTKLEDLRTCNDLIVKHGHALQRSVTDLETATSGSGDKKSVAPAPDLSDIQSKVKILNERATLFKITSNAMINACSEYLELTQNQGIFIQHSISVIRPL